MCIRQAVPEHLLQGITRRPLLKIAGDAKKGDIDIKANSSGRKKIDVSDNLILYNS